MKYLLLFMLVLLNHVEAATPKEKVEGEFRNKLCETLSQKYSLKCLGVGGEEQKNKTKMISLSFTTDKSLNKEEVRKLFVAVVENFLELVNSNEEMKPFLSKHPFTIKDVEVDISFNDLVEKEDPLIHMVYNLNGKVFYISQTQGKKNKVEEKYEEAFSKAKKDIM